MIYNSRDKKHKTPFGAVRTRESVRIALDVPENLHNADIYLVIFLKGEKERFIKLTSQDDIENGFINEDKNKNKDKSVRIMRCSFAIDKIGAYQYYFKINKNLYIKRTVGGKGEINDGSSGELWQLTVYDAKFNTPEYAKGGIYYQIFPDRFYSSKTEHKNVPEERLLRSDWGGQPFWIPSEEGKYINCDYFGGDLKGIEEKLPYLKSLGVTVIYLNPIFEAHSNHRYNTANYFKIDPLLGCEKDFISLCEKAKKEDIHIILDGVFSHTGDDSVYFNKYKRYGNVGAYNDPESEYVKWYNFRDYPDDYRSWWGFRSLPELNKNNPEYIKFACDVVKHWISLGADGFRLDVADELPDEFIRSLRKAAGDKLIIGEVWEDASNKESYGVQRTYLLGNSLDSVMNYPFKDAILEFLRNCAEQKNDRNKANNKYELTQTTTDYREIFIEKVMTIVENYPKPALDVAMNCISTHDTVRAITMLAGKDLKDAGRREQSQTVLTRDEYNRGRELLKLAMVMQYFLPGMPCIYYGDEAGLQGYKDPFNRGCYPWGHEDTELVEFVRTLGKLRKKIKPCEKGFIKFTKLPPPLLGFYRYDDDNNIIMIIINPTENIVKFDIPQDYKILAGDMDNGFGYLILGR